VHRRASPLRPGGNAAQEANSIVRHSLAQTHAAMVALADTDVHPRVLHELFNKSWAVRALVYGLINWSSTVAIVLANKFVLYIHGFSFPVSLTFLHTVTWLGMWVLLLGGAYQCKAVARHLCLRLAAAHSACIV
jgi:hypothetical protein